MITLNKVNLKAAEEMINYVGAPGEMEEVKGQTWVSSDSSGPRALISLFRSLFSAWLFRFSFSLPVDKGVHTPDKNFTSAHTVTQPAVASMAGYAPAAGIFLEELGQLTCFFFYPVHRSAYDKDTQPILL